MSEDRSGTSERRHLNQRVVTILSCGVSRGEGAAADTSRRAFQRDAAELLDAAGASVELEPDHALTASFGCRGMRETDAERAVLAALKLVSAKKTRADLAGIDIRIGIASGLVWTGSAPLEERCSCATCKQVLLQALSLRDLAAPDTVLITASTRDFVKDLFEYSDAAPPPLRNFFEPVPIFTVLRPSQTENRFQALRSQRLHLLGRDHELALLQRLWTKACGGWGQAVIIAGEQGMGKSRLASEFERRLTSIPSARLRLFASPHHEHCPLYPFTKLMERLSGFEHSDTTSIKLEKLRDFLVPLGLGSSQEFAVFSDILGLADESFGAASDPNKTTKRELFLQAFLKLIEAQALQGSLLIIFEDIHWADAASRELLGLIVRHVPSRCIMLVATARPGSRLIGARLTWASVQTATIELRPLRGPETAASIPQLLHHYKLTSQMLEHIVDAACGIPLFIEELTKALLDAGVPLGPDGRLRRRLEAPLAMLPISIQAALLAEVDRLGSEKPLAQISAVLGRRFSHDLLASVGNVAAGELNQGLARLIEAGLIVRSGGPASAEYRFKCVLVQEAAYSSIPAEERKKIHLRAAKAMEAVAKRRPIEPELLAHHLTQAAENTEAIRWWLKAGHTAQSRSENLDAIEHLSAGLKLLRKISSPSDKKRLERQLLIAMGSALMAVKAYGAPEVQKAFERAMELTDDATPVDERLQIVGGLWGVHCARGELYLALDRARQYFDLAQASGSKLNYARCVIGQTLAPMGELNEAKGHFEAVVRDFRRRQIDGDGEHSASIEFIFALSYLNRVYFALGCLDQAAAACEEALSAARRSADAVSIAIALLARMFLATHSADVEDAAAYVEEASAHYAAHGLPLFEQWAIFNRGALLVRLGNIEAGIGLMQSSIEQADARRSPLFRPFQLQCIAGAYLLLRNFNQAIRNLDEGLSVARKTGEKWSEPGLHRTRGEALMALGRRSEAYSNFELAMTVARQQGAALEILRIATALARYAVSAEEVNEARDLLSMTYARLEEGRHTPALRDAREQLAILEGKGSPR